MLAFFLAAALAVAHARFLDVCSQAAVFLMSLMYDVTLGLRGNVHVGVRPRVRLLRSERIFVGLRQLGVARTRICIYLPLCRQHCPDKLAHRRLRKAVGTAAFRISRLTRLTHT